MKKLLLLCIALQSVHSSASAPDQEYRQIEHSTIKLAPKSAPTITVKHAITEDMVTYKQHWSGHHTPKVWTLRINGKEVHPGEDISLVLKKGILKVIFYFEFWVFGKPHRKGRIEAHYKIASADTQAAVEFCWEHPQRLSLVVSHDDKNVALKPIYFVEQEVK